MIDTQNHAFEQVVFASDRLFRKKPEPVHASDASTAVIVYPPSGRKHLTTYIKHGL